MESSLQVERSKAHGANKNRSSNDHDSQFECSLSYDPACYTHPGKAVPTGYVIKASRRLFRKPIDRWLNAQINAMNKIATVSISANILTRLFRQISSLEQSADSRSGDEAKSLRPARPILPAQVGVSAANGGLGNAMQIYLPCKLGTRRPRDNTPGSRGDIKRDVARGSHRGRRSRKAGLIGVIRLPRRPGMKDLEPVFGPEFTPRDTSFLSHPVPSVEMAA